MSIDNAKRKTITWGSITGSAAFRRGVADYQAGLAFDPDAFRSGPDRWHYERGRLYAAACEGAGCKPLPGRLGRRLNYGMIAQFQGMFARKEII